jgi:hypothetical protein
MYVVVRNVEMVLRATWNLNIRWRNGTGTTCTVPLLPAGLTYKQASKFTRAAISSFVTLSYCPLVVVVVVAARIKVIVSVSSFSPFKSFQLNSLFILY